MTGQDGRTDKHMDRQTFPRKIILDFYDYVNLVTARMRNLTPDPSKHTTAEGKHFEM